MLLHKGLPKVLPLWMEAFGLTSEPRLQLQYYDSGPMLLAESSCIKESSSLVFARPFGFSRTVHSKSTAHRC